MPKKIMVQCATQVDKGAVSRTNIGGVEHIIVSSYTLPDDVVMNGGLYPADEIAASFDTLERTLAPVEHPQDDNGNFLPASDPIAIHNFHAGAWNMNVTRSEGRVRIEKHINVQEAMKTDRGKRLLDRINELETSDKPRAIHTSVGLFLEVEDLDEPQTNAAGDTYHWIGRNFVFDHDAILLDSVGAATPDKGVGMAVNSDGEEVEVQRVSLSTEPARPPATDHRTNAEGPSFQQVMEQIQHQITGLTNAEYVWLVDVFNTEAIFETPQGFFSVQWQMMNGTAQVNGLPIRVEKKVAYIPKVNSNEPPEGEDEMFKEMVVNTLKEAGLETDGLTDEQLMEKYNEHLAANAEKGAKGGDAKSVVEIKMSDEMKQTLDGITDKVDALAAKVNANDEAELMKLATIVGNSDKHPGIDVEEAKALPLGTLKKMAANCVEAHGVGLDFTPNSDDEAFAAPTDAPE
jgi:hypothetical protein